MNASRVTVSGPTGEVPYHATTSSPIANPSPRLDAGTVNQTAAFTAGWEGHAKSGYGEYRDPSGALTAGIGHLVRPGEDLSGLDRNGAMALFAKDLKPAIDAVHQLVHVSLTKNQTTALSDMVFNVGKSAFSHSNLLKELNAGNYSAASRHFEDWDKIHHKYSQGLHNRDVARERIFNTPDNSRSVTVNHKNGYSRHGRRPCFHRQGGVTPAAPPIRGHRSQHERGHRMSAPEYTIYAPQKALPRQISWDDSPVFGANGNIVAATISAGVIAADAVIEERSEDTTIITENPVENGSVTNDHAYDLAQQLEMTYAWSPWGPGRSESFLNSIYSQFVTLKKGKVLLSVLTGRRSYTNMLITGLSVTTDRDTENVLVIRVSLRELMLVSSVVPSTIAGASNQTNPASTMPTMSTGSVSLQPAPNYNSKTNQVVT